MAEQFVGQLGYFGIALVLVLGGFGLPIPEEAPVLLAAILSRNGQLHGPTAFAACLGGVLLGDFLVYAVGYRYGERVLSLRLTRRLLTKPRETQIKGYFHRHGFKILVLGRFAVGFRTAAYLTAGILKLPPLKLLLTDLVAALLSTSLVFTLGYLFAHQVEKGLHEAQQWVAVAIAAGVGGWLLYRYYKARRRAGLPVGPPVLAAEEVRPPSDDLHARPEPPPAAVAEPRAAEGGDSQPPPAAREVRFDASREGGASPAARA